MDNGSPVSEAYQPPFAYGGIIKKVTINIQPSTLTASEQQTVRDAERAAALSIE
jgi:arylsulfatase